MSDEPVHHFMIQIERPEVKLDLEAAQSILAPSGVEVDTSYKPVCVNPKLGRYVLRGTATDKARSEAEKIEGVSMFPDLRVRPAKA